MKMDINNHVTIIKIGPLLTSIIGCLLHQLDDLINCIPVYVRKLRVTRLGQLGANISPDRSSLTTQVLIGNFLFNPFVVCHKYWEKLYELQHINLLSLYLPKEDGVSPDVEYITQQIIFSIFLQ